MTLEERIAVLEVTTNTHGLKIETLQAKSRELEDQMRKVLEVFEEMRASVILNLKLSRAIAAHFQIEVPQ